MKELSVDLKRANEIITALKKINLVTTRKLELDDEIKDVYTFVYKIQEEAHRVAITKMDAKRRKTYKKSSLENIEGVGEKTAKALLLYFGGLKNIKNASLDELESVVLNKLNEVLIEYSYAKQNNKKSVKIFLSHGQKMKNYYKNNN